MAEAGMVIVGAGKAGARAVVGLREHNWQGPITLVGEEAIAPYDRPPLSKASVTEESEPAPILLLDEETIHALGVTWLAGTAATTIDRAAKQVVLADGRRIAYAKLLIATGAKPRKLNIPGAGRALLLRDFADTLALRKVFVPGATVAIIGGGFIGLELASSAAKLGCAVTVIEAMPRVLLRGVAEEVAAVIAARHAEAGVNIIANAKIARIEAQAVILEDGRPIPAAVLIAGIGAAPAVQLGEAAGLTIDNGIVCDDHLRTSAPDIYAAGDCCSFPHPVFAGRRMRLEAWRSAQDQAAVAAENMAGGDRRFEAVPWFWSDQYELGLQIAGLPSDGTHAVNRPLKDGAFIVCHLKDDGTLVGASGIGKGNTIARDIRLLEMLIGKNARPDPAALADPATQLKGLLKA
ncbi:MAG: FAD-dependent oxidoreductase [Rhizobiales bacterium]|nr:FAD-dependent oxidoreductase [Hyphomicrobiales bacterium]